MSRVVPLLLSLACPGLGQVHNGEIDKALWLFLAFTGLTVPGIAVIALHLPDVLMLPVLGLGLLAALGTWIWGMVDAFHRARPSTHSVAVYLGLLVLGDLVALPAGIGWVRAHQVESFRIPSASMEPSVLRGDVLFADKRYNHPGGGAAIRRGDLGIFTYPNDRSLTYIKRIVALPGDHVQIQDRVVRLNDQALSDPGGTTETVDGQTWEVRWPTDDTTTVDLVVPPGQVYVLGDNRGESHDSRLFGTVPMGDVVGRARQIWFSKGEDGIRWGRMGRVL